MMFRDAKSLKNKNVLKKWKFSKNTDFDSMFRDSPSNDDEYEVYYADAFINNEDEEESY